ncbi:MAG: hypothetical protein K0R59_146 [Sphingobacterium sp.]|jgi:hypothetical protein|nr:hypothetical protein [Sphingobacterium sp.]
MHTRTILLFVTLLLGLSCTKDPIVKKEDPPEMVPADTSKKVPSTPVDKFELRKIRLQMNEFFADDSIDEKVYLGSLWHLRDTLMGPQLESLAAKAKKAEFHILSYNDASIDMGFFVPSFNDVLSYANKFKKSKQASSINFESSTFGDYAEIQSYLGNSKDKNKVLSLVMHSDSTTIQKPNSTLLINNVNKLTLFIDHTEYLDTYPESEIAVLTTAGYSPYVLASVTYGTQMILMGESDSTRVDLNEAVEKLLKNGELNERDIKVLDCSNLLIYYRGGGKKSFIQYPKGAEAIRAACKDLLLYVEQTENIFNYPLSYSFMSLVDYGTLQYYNVYDVRVKK